MKGRLPETFDPRGAAQEGLHLVGELSLELMPRLRQVVLEPLASAQVDLVSSRDENARVVVHGRVSAPVRVLCQRCLEAFEFRLESAVSLAVVGDEAEADELPEHYDPLLMAPGVESLRLATVIEDELLLAMPDHARHPQPDCGAGRVVSDARERAFAALAQLKTNGPGTRAPE